MIRLMPILTIAILATAGAIAANGSGADDSPLLKAVAGRQVADVRKLLDSGADPNAASASGETPLLAAARLGAPELVHVLINHGAKATTRLPNGKTALHLGGAIG